MNEPGATGSHLSYVNMSYGTQINAYNLPSFTIDHCTTQNCVNGINSFSYTASSYGNLQYNTIINPQDHGIIAQLSAFVECGYNVIKKTSEFGGYQSGAAIYLGAWGSSNFYHNQIEGFNWGVGAVTNGYADFTQPWPPVDLNNHLDKNLNGLMIYNGSYICLDGPYSGGYNGIHGNNFGAYLEYQSTADASNNYWNNGNVNHVGYGCSIGTSDSLVDGCPYERGPYFQKSGNSDLAESATVVPSPAPMNARNNPGEYSLAIARELKKSKQYKQAISYLVGMIKAQKQVVPALLELAQIKQPEFQADLFAAMQQLKDIAPVMSRSLSGAIALRTGDIASAKANNSEIMNISPNTPDSRRAKLALFNIALFAEKDFAAAKSLLAEVVAYKDESMTVEISLAQQAYDILVRIYGQKTGSQLVNQNQNGFRAVEKDANLPTTYELYQNYPNPFNPVTTINYDLPEASHVGVKIYDYIGREVITLVDGYKDAGRFQAKFDASRFGSGVYFYKLQAGSYTSVKKMLFVK